MLIHRFDTNCGHDNRCAGVALGADGTEQIGRLKAAILWCPWPCATSPPDPCQRTLLTNTGFVAEPDLHRLARRLWRQCRGYESRKLRLKDACLGIRSWDAAGAPKAVGTTACAAAC